MKTNFIESKISILTWVITINFLEPGHNATCLVQSWTHSNALRKLQQKSFSRLGKNSVINIYTEEILYL